MEFKQDISGIPPDIIATCSYEELEDLRNEMVQAGYNDNNGAFVNINEALSGSEPLTYIIPGVEAGEVGELNNDLETFLDDLNEKTIIAAEKEN